MHTKNIQDKKFALKVNKIKKDFGQKNVLDDVSFSLFLKEKVGFVGPNGVGKSTLLKIIAGKLESDSGSIEVFKNMKVSYLPQELESDTLVSKYLFTEKEPRLDILNLLIEFNLKEDILERKISHLSGGQKTKIFLMKISIEKSPVILLDEPTNNLDIDGQKNLSKVISRSDSAFLIVSHNRDFLDKTISKIVELDFVSKNINSYGGNYSFYVEEKKERQERQDMLYRESQRQKKKMEKEIVLNKQKAARNLSGVNFSGDNDKLSNNYKKNMFLNTAARKVRDFKRSLENLEDLDSVAQKRPLKIDFSFDGKSSTNVLKVTDLSLAYGFSGNINFDIFSKDILHIQGINGSGKTTLLKTLLGSIEPKSGTFIWGENVRVGYLPQDFLKEDNLEKTFLDWFLENSNKSQTDARKVLFRFGFAEFEVKEKVKNLSPGLRGRGRIALMFCNNPNVLILDEPTNNLDLEVLEEFEKALLDFPGSIIFTSHDQRFVEKIKVNKFLKLA